MRQVLLWELAHLLKALTALVQNLLAKPGWHEWKTLNACGARLRTCTLRLVGRFRNDEDRAIRRTRICIVATAAAQTLVWHPLDDRR